MINQYNQVFRDVATHTTLDLVDTVRLLAMGSMIGADAGMTCMESKYHYLLWRPVTAIRNADKDGNAATDRGCDVDAAPDDAESSRVPGGARLRDGGRGRVFRLRLKTTNIDVDIPGATGGGTTLTTTSHYDTVDDLRKEIVEARIYAGLHYRGSGMAGVELGRQVGQWTLKRFFLPAT